MAILSSIVLTTVYLLLHIAGLTIVLEGVLPDDSLLHENDVNFFSGSSSDNSSTTGTGTPARLPVLVVGGSDGSGTRAVVDTLRTLGVTVVSDDHDTLDIHATAIFQRQGWPKFVTTFLEATGGSLTTEFKLLPIATQKRLAKEMSHLQRYISTKYANERRRQRLSATVYRHPRHPRAENNNNDDDGAHASKVAFVFKAPATMLVLPVLLNFLQPIRFIHVIREYVLSATSLLPRTARHWYW